MKNRINFRIPERERELIEAVIKREYPKLRNVSEVVRAALGEFLKDKT